MKAEFIGCTLVVTPETDAEKEQLKYYGGPSDHPALWECFGWEENEQSWSAQGLCPVGLQAHEILDRLRYLMELDPKPLPPTDNKKVFYERIKQDMDTVDKIGKLLEES